MTVNAGAYKTLMSWATRWPQRRFAVEGANGLGRGIAQLLAAGGEDVVDVPATLAARARLLDTGGTRKTDSADAASVAHVAMRRKRLRPVVAEDQTTQLRLLAGRRDDLAGERVRVLNRLHVLLRDLLPGGAALDLTANKAAALLRTVRPITTTDACRRDLATALIADLRRLDRHLVANQAKTREGLATAQSTITDIHGVGTILAGKILGHVGDADRFPDQRPLRQLHRHRHQSRRPAASTSGTVSTPGATGNSTPRCTPSPFAKPATPDPAASTTVRKIDEGKTPAEARRALKRRLANVLYRHILKGQQRLPATGLDTQRRS